ncbi:MAG: N-acetylmuramoyl-L-alanine amidase [Treponema sp.]|nr:N-acetylmuramoyl-L-alanine amidase [Treponema sp.]MBR1715253.1 N-acetylmuramoyl-L-alanine amidase [Treponema sp.]
MRKILSLVLFFFSFFHVHSANSVNLLAESNKIGVSVLWDSLSNSGILEKAGHQISFHAGDPFVLHDFSKLVVSDSPELKNGVLFVSPKFMDDVKDFFKDETEHSAMRIGAILIDPGHGGKDPGANAVHKIDGKLVTVNEKEITLRASKMVYEKLKKAYPDKQILLTRSKDTTVSLEERTKIANSVKLDSDEAILYISIHANSHVDKNVRGYEVWYLSPDYRRTVIASDSDEDENLAIIMNSMMEEEYTLESGLISQFIMMGLKEQIGEASHSRGIKTEEWFVVRNSNMPAVLIELGFVSNASEAKNLISSDYLQKLSLGIYNGISAFVAHFERTSGFTAVK